MLSALVCRRRRSARARRARAGSLLVAVSLAASVASGCSPTPPRPGGAAWETSLASASPGAAATGVRPSPALPDGPAPSASVSVRAQDAALAAAYLKLADAHNARVTELLIANPLAEFDLVGVPLIDLLDLTRQRLIELSRPPDLDQDLDRLERAMARATDLLRAVDPHGPRDAQAEAYRAALDDWVAHVEPLAAAVRGALALPPVPGGDLRL